MQDSQKKTIIVEKVMKVGGGVSQKIYKVKSYLGRGGFASCYQVVDQGTEKQYACKIVKKSKLVETASRDRLLLQIKIHRSLHHENVVQLINVFEDESHIYIILELCRYNSLSKLLKSRGKLTQYEIRYLYLGVVRALIYTHDNNIIHRDVKAGNILLAQGFKPKLSDFGLSVRLEFDGEKKRTMCGTPNYIAPDVLEEVGYSFQIDVWAIGVLLYLMFFGSSPFQSKDLERTYRQIKNVKFSIPKGYSVPASAVDLIQKILVSDPKERLSLVQILNHPFLSPELIPHQLPEQTLIEPGVTQIDRTKEIPKIKLAMPGERRRFDNQVTHHTNLFELALTDRAVEVTSRSRERSLGKDPAKGPSNQSNETFVLRWVSFEQKYGIGFELSNNSYGAYFKDNTIFVVDQKLDEVMIVERSDTEKKTVIERGKCPADKETAKKLKLVEHMRKGLPETRFERKERGTTIKRGVYVKQFIKVKQDVLFRLSNGVVDMFLQNGSELIFQSLTNRLRFWDEKGVQFRAKVGEVDEDSEFFDAFSYMRWTLKQFSNVQRQ